MKFQEKMKKKIIFGVILVLSISRVMATNFNIIPYPQHLIPQKGKFAFKKQTNIIYDAENPELKKLVEQFSNQIELVSSFKLKKADRESAISNNIVFKLSTDKSENTEAYQLNVSAKNITIEASTPNGIFYGLQTLYQMMPPEIYGKTKAKSTKWIVPAAEITDKPRFSYRGLHLDVCRHYFPLEFIKKYIDAMAIHKLNRFHWHLTDDQGWRIEIKKYPKLTEIGSKRAETLIGYYYERFPQEFDGKPHEGYYTQEEAREIVKYAADRFIQVIPEIEMPGHAQAALAAYPYLSCNNNPNIKVATKWGIFEDVYCPRDTTFQFLKNVLTEIMDIFPSKYIHIGGDECPKTRWQQCADCQAIIKRENLKDEHELQSYFIKRIEKFVNSKGRRIIGWDEILDGGLAPDATVMSWRGIRGGIAAAKSGHDVIMTPTSACYFDFYQSDPETEPTTIGGFTPLSKVYSFEPIPTELTEQESTHILGAQANVWTEYMATTENVEYMVFPRIAAMSEVLWCNKDNRSWDLFCRRMPTQFARYKQLNIQPSNAFYSVSFQSNLTADNKLQITLNCDYPNAKIKYSINGKERVYTTPFILNESAEITASAFEKGEKLGKSSSKSYIVSKLTGANYSLNVKNTGYNGGNVFPLTDGVKGNTKVSNQWLSIRDESDTEIIIDLKEPKEISKFSVGLLSAPGFCARLSPEIKLFGSTDGENYQLLSKKELTTPATPTWEIFRPELSFAKTEVRFLKLQLKDAGACPEVALNRSNKSMLMIDEIAAW